MFKIMWKSEYGTEEIDETESIKDANSLVKEYQMAFKIGTVYHSIRG
tara:strand:+ start:36 stop:176 length:141 start_codon:yes stop_codon:yes gene_type:complete